MVGVGPMGRESTLARVSVVNYFGVVLMDEFVRQKERVTDWRTQWSGVRARDMINGDSYCLRFSTSLQSSYYLFPAKTFEEVQGAVAELMKDRIVIGHAIQNDLKVRFVLFLLAHGT
jgi:RNA exonuclease 4